MSGEILRDLSLCAGTGAAGLLKDVYVYILRGSQLTAPEHRGHYGTGTVMYRYIETSYSTGTSMYRYIKTTIASILVVLVLEYYRYR
jgi:hypothetical protein